MTRQRPAGAGASPDGKYPQEPGIGVAGESENEVRELVAEAIRLYLEELERDESAAPESVQVSSLHHRGLTARASASCELRSGLNGVRGKIGRDTAQTAHRYPDLRHDAGAGLLLRGQDRVHRAAAQGGCALLPVAPAWVGKSLFLDTLKEVFEGNEELFDGLYIHDLHDWSNKVAELSPPGSALARLRERDYAARYRGRGEPIHVIGVEFSRQTRNVTGFEVAAG